MPSQTISRIARPEAGPFSRIPAEIRNQIYHEVLSVDQIDLSPKDEVRRRQHRAWNRSPPEKRLCTRQVDARMLRVCRLFHTEASPILYGNNTFVLSSELVGPFQSNWLGRVGASNRQLIRKVEVRFTTEQVRRAIRSNADIAVNLMEALYKVTGVRSIALLHREPDQEPVKQPGVAHDELVLAALLNKVKSSRALLAHRIYPEGEGRVTLADVDTMKMTKSKPLRFIEFDDTQTVRTKLWYCVRRGIDLNWTDLKPATASIKLWESYDRYTEIVRWIEELECGPYRLVESD